MRALFVAIGLLLLAAPLAAADKRPASAAPPAARKLAPAELCEYQNVVLRDREAQLNLQIAELQQQLVQARADLQRVQLAERLRAIREKAGAKDGEIIDPNSGEVKAAPAPPAAERK